MQYILVPTDFSPAANNALRYAIQFARAKKMQIRFFHAVHSIRNIHEFMEEKPEEFKAIHDKAEKELKRNILAQYKKLGFKSGTLHTLIKVGESFEGCLAEAIQESRATMIIMGTHGKTNLRDVLLGSNASHVIATAPVPVLCVPAKSQYTPVKELTYFTDLDNLKNELAQVKRFARALGSKLSVVHFDYSWARTAEEERLLKRLASSKLDFHNLKASIDISLNEHIRRFLRGKHSLPCLFHDRKGALARLLTGSNPEEAPVKVHAPILSFQRAA